MMVFTALLFFVLSPGVLLSLPSGGSKFMKAAVHAVIFSVVCHFTCNLVDKQLYGFTM